MKNEFGIAAERNKLLEERNKTVRDYFASEEFLDRMRKNVKERIIKENESCTWFQPEFETSVNKGYLDKKTDMPYLQEAFLKLKKEYPELNHIRVNGCGFVIIDTKPNTWFTRSYASYDSDGPGY